MADAMTHFVCPTCKRPVNETPAEEEIIRSWNVYEVNLTRRRLTIHLPEGPQSFTFTEGETLYILSMVRASGRTCNKEYMLEYVHGNRPEVDQPELKIVDVKVCFIRKKLGALRTCVHTEWGSGYRLLEFVNGEWK